MICCLCAGKKTLHIEDRSAPEKDPAQVMEKYFAGKFNFPVTMLSSPDRDIAVRTAKDENINMLMRSFADMGVKPTIDIRVVLRSISAYHTHIAPVDKKQAPKKLTPTALKGLLQSGGRKLEVIVGDHSHQALKLLSTQTAREDLLSVPISFYILPWDRSKPDACHKLVEVMRNFGLQDNIVKDRRTVMSPADLCKNLRSFFTAARASGKSDTEAKRYAKEQFQMSAGSGTWKTGTLDTWMRFCSATDRQFNLMIDILNGKVIKSRTGVAFKPPGSPLFMQVTGDVDPVLVCTFLEQVIAGKDSIADFTFKCKKHKSIAAMKRKIVENYFDDSSKSWEELEAHAGVSRVNSSFDIKFWETWGERAGRASGVGSTIPQGFELAVASLIASWNRPEASASSEASQVRLYNCTSYPISSTVVDVSFIFQVQAPKDQWHRTVNSSALTVNLICGDYLHMQGMFSTKQPYRKMISLYFDTFVSFHRVRSL